VGLEGIVGAAGSMFLSGSCLMHGEGEEAKIGIVVALSLVLSKSDSLRTGLPLSPLIFVSMKSNHRLEGVPVFVPVSP
jgi:hypothetical protein